MIRLVDFTSISRAEFWLIYAWRNDSRIAAFSTSGAFGVAAHEEFISSLKSNSFAKYFLVYKSGDPIGVISFHIGLDSASFGIYQNPNLSGNGDTLMGAILDYAKNCIKTPILKATVMPDNERAIALYKRFGFKIGETNRHKELEISLNLTDIKQERERESSF